MSTFVRTPLLTLLALAVAPAAARADDPIPGVEDRYEGGAHVGVTGDIGVLKRGSLPGQWQGDVTMGVSMAAPGTGSAAPDGLISGRIGFGYGLMARLDVSRSGLSGDFRPGVGLYWQFLGREAGPVSLAVGGQYRPEGFAEPEGEIELQLLGTLRRDAFEVTANLVGGADPELNESDVEGALGAGWRPLPSLLVGAEARTRWAFGKEAGSFGSIHDELVGALASWRVDRFLLTGVAGVALLTTDDTDVGFGGSVQAALGW